MSNKVLLKGTVASETTGLTSTPFLGPPDTPQLIRRPRVHLGLGRPARAFQALSAPRPTFRDPCPWDGSGAHAHGDFGAVRTMRTRIPSPGPAAESLLGSPLPDARPRGLGPPSEPRGFRSPLLVGDAPRTLPARPAERHKDTRVAKPWLSGSCPGKRPGSVDQLERQNTPSAPAGAPTSGGHSREPREVVLLPRPPAAHPHCPDALGEADPGTVPCLGPQRNPIERDF